MQQQVKSEVCDPILSRAMQVLCPGGRDVVGPLMLLCQQRSLGDLQRQVSEPGDAFKAADEPLASSSTTSTPSTSDGDEMTPLTPKELVEHLDRNIVGQVCLPWAQGSQGPQPAEVSRLGNGCHR